MEGCVKTFLEEKGYSINTKAAEIIKTCDDWYSNRRIKGFHDRKTIQGVAYELSRLNFAKRCCSDDANLCEILEINAGAAIRRKQSTPFSLTASSTRNTESS